MKAAYANGRLGAAVKLSATQEAHLVTLYRDGERPVSELGEFFGVNRSAVCGAIERTRARERT